MLGLVAGGVIGWWFIGLLRCLLCWLFWGGGFWYFGFVFWSGFGECW